MCSLCAGRWVEETEVHWDFCNAEFAQGISQTPHLSNRVGDKTATRKGAMEMGAKEKKGRQARRQLTWRKKTILSFLRQNTLGG